MQTGKQDHVLPVKVRACLIKKIVTCPGKIKHLLELIVTKTLSSFSVCQQVNLNLEQNYDTTKFNLAHI